jgi:hypothetical protein
MQPMLLTDARGEEIFHAVMRGKVRKRKGADLGVVRAFRF